MEKEFKEFVSALKEAKRRNFIRDFALTGALALSALTQPRATRDMDFIVSIDKEKIAFFVDWLKTSKEYKFTKHHAGRKKDHIKDLIEVRTGTASADLIVAAHAIEKEALNAGLTVLINKNVRLKIVRPEYLIVLKLLAGSEQDYVDCANLWNEPVDKKLIRKLAKELFLEKKLANITAKARGRRGK